MVMKTVEDKELLEMPIGVFDSGMGGLTVMREIMRQIPNERIIYFGDTARVPYGSKSRETVTRYSRQIVRFLQTQKVKAIVVACNTASAYALDDLEKEIDIPIIGVVRPGAKTAAEATRNGQIGVIATAGTIGSGIYTTYIRQLKPDVQVTGKACPLFVPLVENGRVHRGDVVIETVVAEYLAPLKAAGVDTLILGCTHYPLLEEVIGAYMGPEVTLIDSGAEAANLASTQFDPGSGPGETRYFVSDDPGAFDQLAELFLQEQVGAGAGLVDISGY